MSKPKQVIFFTFLILVTLLVGYFARISMLQNERLNRPNNVFEESAEGSDSGNVQDTSGNIKHRDVRNQNVAKLIYKEDGHIDIELMGEAFDLTESFLDQFEKIVSTDISNYNDRHDAVQNLSYNLNGIEIEALYVYLLAPPPETEMLRKRDRALKNEVMNRLRVQQETPEDILNVFIMMFNNTDQDKGVRDYAMQQIHAWQKDAPNQDKALILETMLQGLNETESGIAGTALLGLWEFRGSVKNTGLISPEIEEEIRTSALEIASSDRKDMRSRITALQLMAQEAPHEIIDTAIQWALNPELNYSYRLSGIAALGISGSEKAMAALEELERVEDPYLAKAVLGAYQRNDQ